jgi:hypothetical protein
MNDKERYLPWSMQDEQWKKIAEAGKAHPTCKTCKHVDDLDIDYRCRKLNYISVPDDFYCARHEEAGE